MKLTTRLTVATLFIILCSLSIALAQQESPANAQSPVPIVTATASQERVRYVAVGEVHQTRLQVFSTDGTQVFDSDYKLGNLIDWQFLNQQGQHLTDGTYLFLVTVRDFSDHLTQKYGTAVLEQEQVYLQQGGLDELARAPSASFEANKLSEVLFPVDRVGVAAMSRTSPASAGGADLIGNEPAGKQTLTAQAGTTPQSISGTGTTGKLTKWTNGATGVLGDSVVTEGVNKVGINVSPTATLHVNNAQPTALAANGTKAPLLLQTVGGKGGNTTGTTGQVAGAGAGITLVAGNGGDAPAGSTRGAGGSITLQPGSTGVGAGPAGLNGNVLLAPAGAGNIGVGTTAPTSKLQVKASGYGITQTDGTVTMGSFINPTGGWFGTRSNHPLYFFTKDSLPQMTLLPNGNFGVGITNPTTKLYVLSAGAGVSAVYGESTSGRGVWGKSTGGSRGVYGESDSGEGVHGESVTGTGVAAHGATGVTGLGTTGSGVYGESPVSSLTAAGVYGKGTGSGGIGVIGKPKLI